jgi:hypothetical protein
MHEKAKRFLKEHQAELIAGTIVAVYGLSAFYLGTKVTSAKNGHIKSADELIIDGESRLLVTFRDGTTQMLRGPSK